MVARTPIFNIFWITVNLSPFSLIAIPVILHLPNLVIYAAQVLGSALATYFYLAIGRHWRRRIKQSVVRQRALKEDKPFVLISRSYGQSVEFQTAVPIPSLINRQVYITLFEAVVYDVSYTHPIVVLGDNDLHPDDPAARALFVSKWPDPGTQRTVIVYNNQTHHISSNLDRYWEDIFLFLAGKAHIVLVIPAISNGVLREIELLRDNGLASKAVVYMWPEKRQPYTAISGTASDWRKVQTWEPLKDIGLNLPDHEIGGQLLRLSNDLSITDRTAVPPRNILSAVAATQETGERIALRDVAPLIRDIEIAADANRYGPMWSMTWNW